MQSKGKHLRLCRLGTQPIPELASAFLDPLMASPVLFGIPDSVQGAKGVVVGYLELCSVVFAAVQTQKVQCVPCADIRGSLSLL